MLAGYRATLHEEAAHGRVVTARQYLEVAAQARAWTDAGHGRDLCQAGADVSPRSSLSVGIRSNSPRSRCEDVLTTLTWASNRKGTEPLLWAIRF